jgi:cytochrome b
MAPAVRTTLLGLAATTWSGLMAYAYDEQAGPLASFVAPSGNDGRRNVGDEEREAETSTPSAFEAREDYWENTHELLVNLTLFLVLLHIGGVLLASFVHRENLVAAMFTGRKRDLDRNIRPADPNGRHQL